MSEIDKLLAVLDMPEDEQIKFLENYPDECFLADETFADLAFRLRDEARKENLEAWNGAIHIVASYINESPMPQDNYATSVEWQWAQHIILNQNEYSLAIIWIIAALIAKKLAGRAKQ